METWTIERCAAQETYPLQARDRGRRRHTGRPVLGWCGRNVASAPSSRACASGSAWRGIGPGSDAADRCPDPCRTWWWAFRSSIHLRMVYLAPSARRYDDHLDQPLSLRAYPDGRKAADLFLETCLLPLQQNQSDLSDTSTRAHRHATHAPANAVGHPH